MSGTDQYLNYLKTPNRNPKLPKIFIRFFGMKRSGNHALHNWIIPKFHGGVFLRNNAALKTLVKKKKCDGLNCFRAYDHITKAQRDDNDIIFITYEDLILSDCLEHPANKDNVYGHYDDYKDIFIIRDPYNLFSSRAKHYDKGEALRSDLCVHKRHDLDKLILLWKDMAHRFINPRDGELGIYYDKWFNSLEYRKDICTSLGVEFNDKGKELISGWGGGSSFDDAKTPAEKMKVLERKRGYEKYEFYLKLSEDVELNALLKDINESIK